MSKELGTLRLPAGGKLEVTAYTPPGGGRRVQFVLTQGEGGITACGNMSEDGIAELLGWLESWLLQSEQRRRLALGLWSSRTRDHAEKILELITSPNAENALAYGLGSDIAAELERRARALLDAIPPNVVSNGKPGAAVDGPALMRTVREYEKEELALAAAEDKLETPATDHLETHDTVSALEDFGKVGEERDAAFTRALELRRQGARGTVGTVGGAIRAVRENALELQKEASDVHGRGVLELENLTQAAARYILAVQELEAILRLASLEER